MAEMNPLAIIENELIDFASQFVEEKYIFIGNRPDKTADSMTQFLVVDLPAEILNLTAGNDDFAYRTTAVIYCYYKAKTNSTMNLNGQTSLAYKVKSGFPYVTDHITATRPKILHDGYDNNGFHATSITFRLRTKPNAFKSI